MSRETRFGVRRVDDNAYELTIPYQYAVFDARRHGDMMGPLWTEAEVTVVAKALTRARAVGKLK